MSQLCKVASLSLRLPTGRLERRRPRGLFICAAWRHRHAPGRLNLKR